MSYTPKGYWNYENCLAVAKQCKTRSEFQYGTGNKSAYGAAQKNGWLSDMYQHIEDTRKPKGYWSVERVKAKATKYSSRVDFENNAPTAYGIALREKIMDDICTHMESIGDRANRCIYVIHSIEKNQAYIGLTFSFTKRMVEHKNGHSRSTAMLVKYADTEYVQLTDYVPAKEAAKLEAHFVQVYMEKGFEVLNSDGALGALGGREPWDYERIQLEARKYKTRIDFKRGASSAYRIACKKGWIDEVTNHMPKKVIWSFENVKNEALKYQTRKEFEKGNNSAYVVACRNGWADEVCSHMVRQKPMSTKRWTKELILDVARRYESKSLFRKENKGAYASACRNQWINEVYAIINNNLSKT
ncbi:hypothetical protein ATY36_20355 [Vibrio cidicii]|uniref:GIY-YIG nuclease family protein n=1 Tax=Vibrio cidicii TaxID=1763883 RepID=UPI00078006B4|nr:GIY-YIG nuclease family protein [Vibrio cidicii]KYN80443.1 hypothetical protein ATY36_18460 [Vibrio cidicii]KYN89066.1 hypothetical protein ATY36_20355 [Vibrio cidicii]